MTNEELKAWIDDVRPRINPREVIDDADDIEFIDAILQTVRDHIPDDDYEGDMPETIWVYHRGTRIELQEVDKSLATRYTRYNTLANAIKEKL